MPWVNDYTEFQYTAGLLRVVAKNYARIYEGLPMLHGDEVNPFRIAEYKADFDIALSAIGRRRWAGIRGLDFAGYRPYNKLQQAVIADILGWPDTYLEGSGIRRVPQIRGAAYHSMCDRLNGIPPHGTNTRFN